MIDEEYVTTARFETCFPTFCMAYASLDTSAVDHMKAGATMTMAIKDRAQRDVSMLISLYGFTAAYNATCNAGT
ncbi:MAG: invasion associated locus B family protein, partial [Cohaesibacteraceae bacterium]